MTTHDDRYVPGGDASETPLIADLQRLARRLWSYARSRPTDNWLFFAAGFILAAVLI
ncbi:MAG: hypothetical protein V3R98_06800 [Alphaproteobacteria bacterium]